MADGKQPVAVPPQTFGPINPNAPAPAPSPAANTDGQPITFAYTPSDTGLYGRMSAAVKDARANIPGLGRVLDIGSMAINTHLTDMAAEAFRRGEPPSPGEQYRPVPFNYEAWQPGFSLVNGRQTFTVGNLRGTITYDAGFSGIEHPTAPQMAVKMVIPFGQTGEAPGNSFVTSEAGNLFSALRSVVRGR